MTTATQFLSDPSLGLVREVRPAQIQMTTSVEHVLKAGGVYCGEAGTGVGKSFAYLLPSLLEPRRRIVVATAKKTLQDQILVKDIPAIIGIVGEKYLRALGTAPAEDGVPIAIALKGKSNYACRLLAEDFLRDAAWARFISRSKYGDRADFPGMPPKWWAQANAEDCAGRCRYSNECGYKQLRSDVAAARVIVVNHHLLGFDIRYGQGEGRGLGGPYDTVIIDEAHKLSEGLRNACSQKVSHSAVRRMKSALDKSPHPSPAVHRLETSWNSMFEALPNSYFKEAYTRSIPVFPAGADDVLCDLHSLSQEVTASLRSYGIKGFQDWIELRQMVEEIPLVNEDARKTLVRLAKVWHRSEDLVQDIEVLQGKQPCEKTNTVIYSVVEVNENSGEKELHIVRAPIVMGPLVRDFFASKKTVVLTSATLAVYNEFDHIPSVIGLLPTRKEILSSPFDYAKQGFIYCPKDIPYVSRPSRNNATEESKRTYDQSVNARIQRALQLVKMSDGGAFILTTANDELDKFSSTFKAALPGRVFTQGHVKDAHDGSAASVFDQFKAHGSDAVLIGSKSFWEGVDVVGEQLRLVIIAKLPFPIQGDPIIEARIQYWKNYAIEHGLGESEQDSYWWAWRRVNESDMVMDLRQGVGRLLRSVYDRGVVAILDSRLWTAKYALKTRMALSFGVTDNLGLCASMLPRYAQYFRKRNQRDSDGRQDAVRHLPGAVASGSDSSQNDAGTACD